MAKVYDSYRVDKSKVFMSSKWFPTMRGAEGESKRMLKKGVHGKIVGIWYDDDNGFHEDELKTF